METPCQRLDLVAIGQLTFEAPDPQRFPALRLAREAMASGGAAPVALNAANEEAVAAFLAGHIGFLDIAETVERVMNAQATLPTPRSIADVIDIDRSARHSARAMMTTKAA